MKVNNCTILVDESSQIQDKTDADSLTQFITAYTIHHQNGFVIPYTLTIVDTPGFGDVQGIKRDREITDLIRTFFYTKGPSGIDHIDAVSFVVQASLPRLTKTQQYIFDSILSLFGKDIANNILSLITFADGKKPKVFAALKKADIPIQKYFKFNNSALFPDKANDRKVDPKDKLSEDEDEDDKNFNKPFWDMCYKSYGQFTEELTTIEDQSLVLTNNVLKNRYQLETYVKGIQDFDMEQALIKRQKIQERIDILKDKKKGLEYECIEEKREKVDLKNQYALNCSACQRTCHYPCDHVLVYTCHCMGWFSGCNVCQCGYGEHHHTQYKYVLSRTTVTKTKDDVKKEYDAATGKLLTESQTLKKAEDDLNRMQKHIIHLTNSAKLAIEELNKIALKPNPMSTEDYIDIMITQEQAEKKEGWKDRFQQLHEVRKLTETIQEISEPNPEKKGVFQKIVEWKTNIFG